jgi:hypothetical protein
MGEARGGVDCIQATRGTLHRPNGHDLVDASMTQMFPVTQSG